MVDLRLSDSELADRRERIVAFIDEQVTAAGADGAVIGLSGGVDSSLVAYLAVEALGTDSVTGLILPAAPSSDASVRDAEIVADRLNIATHTIDIEPVLDALASSYPGSPDERALGNARARIRAAYNYLLANDKNNVVLGTGNKSESLTGYYTKYGDGAVDCHPIGNLYKTQVWQLASDVGVPEQIVEKPPSAELWDNQTDENELGLDYETLDSILALHIDGPLSAAGTARELSVSQETVDHVHSLYLSSQHKRLMPPKP